MLCTLRTVLGSPDFLADVRPRVEPFRSNRLCRRTSVGKTLPITTNLACNTESCWEDFARHQKPGQGHGMLLGRHCPTCEFLPETQHTVQNQELSKVNGTKMFLRNSFNRFCLQRCPCQPYKAKGHCAFCAAVVVLFLFLHRPYVVCAMACCGARFTPSTKLWYSTCQQFDAGLFYYYYWTTTVPVQLLLLLLLQILMCSIVCCSKFRVYDLGFTVH